jgi:hypothetical protein
MPYYMPEFSGGKLFLQAASCKSNIYLAPYVHHELEAGNQNQSFYPESSIPLIYSLE